jgi:hypothetical protein
VGIFDKLKGTREPDPGVAPVSADDMRNALLALNRPTAPWQVRDGQPESVDLVAEWLIVDAKWRTTFAKNGLKETFKVLMRFDVDGREVRAVDEAYDLSWEAGVPQITRQTKHFRGQQTKIEVGRGYGFTEQGEYGEVYNYHFNTNELKRPLKETVAGHGWTYRAVALGKL